MLSFRSLLNSYFENDLILEKKKKKCTKWDKGSWVAPDCFSFATKKQMLSN